LRIFVKKKPVRFELTKEFIAELRQKIVAEDRLWIQEQVLELHYAEVAEILDKLTNDEAKFIYFMVDEDTQADILMELEEEVRDRFLASLSSKEMADQLENLDSDDAADILGDLPDEKIQEVISQMEDDEAAEDIVDLLNYDDDTAGGLMQKEFFQANVEWPVNRAIIELRKQAEDVEKVYNIFVVDDDDHLLGVLSLKRLLFANARTKIENIYQSKKIISVKASDSAEVSFSRLPWLIIAMLGGTIGAKVISNFESSITAIPAMAFFIPLITAMGGNVGVQSSAIVVQSLARGDKDLGRILPKLIREGSVGIMNGLILASLIFLVATVFVDVHLGVVVSLSLFTVILFAAIFGTLFPMILNRYKIDPALAIGPFVTTLNDVIGIFIYFSIGLLLM